jgi:hypothetical protein
MVEDNQRKVLKKLSWQIKTMLATLKSLITNQEVIKETMRLKRIISSDYFIHQISLSRSQSSK